MNANFRSYVLQKSSRISETNVTFSQRNPRNSTLKNYRMMHFDKALVVSLGRRKVEESFEMKPLGCLRNSRFRLETHILVAFCSASSICLSARRETEEKETEENVCTGEEREGLRGRFWFSCTAQDVCTPSCKYLLSAVIHPYNFNFNQNSSVLSATIAIFFFHFPSDSVGSFAVKMTERHSLTWYLYT